MSPPCIKTGAKSAIFPKTSFQDTFNCKSPFWRTNMHFGGLKLRPLTVGLCGERLRQVEIAVVVWNLARTKKRREECYFPEKIISVHVSLSVTFETATEIANNVLSGESKSCTNLIRTGYVARVENESNIVALETKTRRNSLGVKSEISDGRRWTSLD